MNTTVMAQVEVSGEKDYVQKISVGRHELTADEPPADAGPSPFALVLSGLGACTAITLRMYAQRKQWDLGTVRVRLNMLEDGKTSRVERELSFSAPLNEAQRQRLAEISEKTPVTLALKGGMAIHTTLAK